MFVRSLVKVRGIKVINSPYVYSFLFKFLCTNFTPLKKNGLDLVLYVLSLKCLSVPKHPLVYDCDLPCSRSKLYTS